MHHHSATHIAGARHAAPILSLSTGETGMKEAKGHARGLSTPDELFQIIFAFQKPRVVLTAFELGLFTVLGDKSRTSSEAARALRTAPRATDRLMNALCAIGLLAKKNGRFSNSPLAARHLVKGKPDYLAGLGHGVNLWDSWSTLTEAVRRGTSVVAKRVSERGKESLTSFIAAMHARACRMADGIVALLDLSRVTRVLDVGAGSGAYCVAFVRANERIRATAFDLPHVIPLTKKYLKEAGLSERVDTVVGDCNSDSLGKGFDLIFLSALIHSNSFAQNQDLIRKAADALNPHGQVVVQDFIMDENRTSPAFAALFALNMLVGTEAGDTYTESEVRAWMKGAGLSRIVRSDTPYDTTLIIGHKKKK
jgi:precorrin-6B methylase 2